MGGERSQAICLNQVFVMLRNSQINENEPLLVGLQYLHVHDMFQGTGADGTSLGTRSGETAFSAQ